MQIKLFCGYTRLVVVTSCNAYKFALIPPFNLLVFTFVFFFARKKRQKFMARIRKEFSKELKRISSSGIGANRMEYEYYQSTRDPRVVPTKQIFLWGLMVIQEAVLPATSGLFVNPLQKGRELNGFAEVNKPEQFGLKGNTLLLLDYGQEETCEFLRIL